MQGFFGYFQDHTHLENDYSNKETTTRENSDKYLTHTYKTVLP